MKKLIIALLTLTLLVATYSCEKKIINNRIDTNQRTIGSPEDAQAVLDNTAVMGEVPSMGVISDDDICVRDSTFSSVNRNEFNTYVWAADIFEGRGNIADWNTPYQQIFYANVVLDAMSKLKDTDTSVDWNNIGGSALFMRAFAYYQLSQIFTQPFDSANSLKQLGLPIRLSPNPEIHSTRSSLSNTYGQMIMDLNNACKLLPVKVDPNRKNRPSRPAAYALLARLYLVMGDYTEARLYADSCLSAYPVLTDYNDVIVLPKPFTPNGDEVIYQAHLLPSTEIFKSQNCTIDSTLYKSYPDNDLRKVIFFKLNQDSLPISNSTYSGTIDIFAGIATDEIYLIRAECSARLGDSAAAIADMNNLLLKRMKNGSFSFYSTTTTNAAEALKLILTERRKELVLRGLRWADIRRLNSKNAIIDLTRKYNGQKYTLTANDPRFVLPIPPDVIRLSGIEQNSR